MVELSLPLDRFGKAHNKVNVICGDKSGTCLFIAPAIASKLPQCPLCVCCAQAFLSEATGIASISSNLTFGFCASAASSVYCAESLSVMQVCFTTEGCATQPCVACQRVFAALRCTVHTGRQAAKSWQTSIKVTDRSCANLGEWIRRECHKIGSRVVGQKISVWLPSKRLTQVGTVMQYSNEDKEHTVRYHDGTEESLYLAIESYKVEGQILHLLHASSQS